MGISPAGSVSSGAVATDASVAVASKGLRQQRIEGQQAVDLIESASPVALGGRGRFVNLYA